MEVPLVTVPDVASAPNGSSQQRSPDQQLKRLQIVGEGPQSFGQPHRRHAASGTWIVPDITQRSSIMRVPLLFLGKRNSIAARCPSDSQTWRPIDKSDPLVAHLGSVLLS